MKEIAIFILAILFISAMFFVVELVRESNAKKG